jgi:hypothetical protein
MLVEAVEDLILEHEELAELEVEVMVRQIHLTLQEVQVPIIQVAAEAVGLEL